MLSASKKQYDWVEEMAAIKGSKRRNKMVMDCVEMDSRCVACHSESLRELMRSFVVILSTFFTDRKSVV